MEEFEPNPTLFLKSITYDGDLKWVSQNTAILVLHGIGNQLPLETLDQFGRGLAKAYRKEFEDDILLSHNVVSKKDDENGNWSDNVVRISKKGSDHFIDIYEYYWAHYTEDQASWNELTAWLHGVVKGAKVFYKRNASMGQHYKDSSPFFDSRTGAFRPLQYRIFISAASKSLLILDLVYRGLLWVVARIPLLGRLAEKMMKSYSEGLIKKFTNVIGDVVVYNVGDPKSKFYAIRKKMLNGAVKALRFLIERKGDKEDHYYPSVIVAGHSLGSQVAYDCLNRLNLLINQGDIETYYPGGKCKLKNRENITISQQLNGLITFGCPLDKIVFFLRENVPDDQFIRQQLLDHFHGFKMRNLNLAKNENSSEDYMVVANSLKRRLEKITWRNYFDHKDYVSGGLDYYDGLTNIDCQFKSGKFAFTHSEYWACDKFYKDIIINYLK